MIFRTPINGSTAWEIAQEMIGEGEKDFTIKIGDTVLSVSNPGGVLGENIAQLICDLRREIVDVVDELRPLHPAELETEQIKALRDQLNDLRIEFNELEEKCGSLR